MGEKLWALPVLVENGEVGVFDAYHEGDASDDEKFSLGELIMNLDSALDKLSAVYQKQRGNDARYPDLEILKTALSEFKLINSAEKKA